MPRRRIHKTQRFQVKQIARGAHWHMGRVKRGYYRDRHKDVLYDVHWYSPMRRWKFYLPHQKYSHPETYSTRNAAMLAARAFIETTWSDENTCPFGAGRVLINNPFDNQCKE